MADILEMLNEFIKWAKDAGFERYIPIVTGIVFIYMVLRLLIFITKGIKKSWNYVSRNRFLKKKVYTNLSFMESADVYYAISQFIPTRFSTKNDPANDDEPAPIYENTNREKDPLLIEHFIKFEFDVKDGKKYYLCLADCGMGKTTFLINLYCRILKRGKNKCHFISLQEPSCLEQIKEIDKKGDVILLLDALDENDYALTNYSDFMEKLEYATREFYRVIITSRTNFFENESKERLSARQKSGGITSKLPEMRKFYITPFTDDDIKRFLKLRYRFRHRKRKLAWELINHNKNLSVRPMLLRFMDEVLSENKTFEYDFQLYECLFQKWIEREKYSAGDTEGKELQSECLSMAKIIYYQWMKSGQIGIYSNELPIDDTVSGLKNIQIKGHAMLNRTSDGMYKFSHRSYWEYMLAKLALSDVPFSNELLIKNFDRATSFLDEMIQYYQTHQEERSPETVIGIANYLLKYKKPEEAEVLFRKAVDMCNGQKQLQLLALVQQAKCFQQQLKYKSAELTLKKCQDLLNVIPLKKETLQLYTQFGMVFAEHCKISHLIEGQVFLNEIIDYGINEDLKGYDLLLCYEAYCNCCINYCCHQRALSQMEILIKDCFKEDQYASYLLSKARLWKMDYQNQDYFGTIQQAVECGKRFMDLYEQINWYCELGISGVVADEWNEVTAKHLESSYGICMQIYNDEGGNESIKNPYVVRVYQKTVVAYNLLGQGKWEEKQENENRCIDEVFKYMEEHHLQEEMYAIYFILLDYIRKDNLAPFKKIKQATEKRLKIAKENGNSYDLVDAYWTLYLLHNPNHKNRAFAQDYLKRAYELGKDNRECNMTDSYCDLLQTVLVYYRGEIDKEAIANELVKIIPEIYDSDVRQYQIHQGLQKYFSAQNDVREISSCVELLRYGFDYYELERFYNCCIKYNRQEEFIEELNRLCLEKGILSNFEVLILEKFLYNNRNELKANVEKSIKTLLKRNQTLRVKTNTALFF